MRTTPIPSVSDPPDAKSGDELPPDVDGRPRFVCTCRHSRTRWVRGRGWWRWLWYGPMALAFGALLHLVLLAVAVADVPTVVRVLAVTVHVAFVTTTVVVIQRPGHRLGCTLRSLSYWLIAAPAWVVGSLSQFILY